jgi:adenylylsulfate kinase-like enzyme
MKSATRDAALVRMNGAEFTDDDRTEFGKAISEPFGHINDQTSVVACTTCSPTPSARSRVSRGI